MRLLDRLCDDAEWHRFLAYKVEKNFLPDKVVKRYIDYISKRKYSTISQKIASCEYNFSTPIKKMINKTYVGKKRAVYSFNNDENMILKMVSFLLHDYDNLFSDNLYSFRRSIGVKKAICDLFKKNDVQKHYGYKLDISNYFNSIDIKLLLTDLKTDLGEDPELYFFIERILSNPNVVWNGTVIQEKKGVMAGIPISAFLANYYLIKLDWFFYENNVIYARYSDDIIFFSDDPEKLHALQSKVLDYLNETHLEVNHKKEFYYNPGDRIEFLGFSFHENVIDISENTIKKIKMKIKRAARSIRRWMINKHAPEDTAIRVMIDKFDRKFFGKEEDEITWAYWFFPSINTASGLKEVDRYLQDELRFMITGKHNKCNYEQVPYSRLVNNGYTPLVSEYYKYKCQTESYYLTQNSVGV